MTLDDAIRKSNGRRFKRPRDKAHFLIEAGVLRLQGVACADDCTHTPMLSVDDLLADDWQVEQTAPHGEGM